MEKVTKDTPFSLKADDWNKVVEASAFTLMRQKQGSPTPIGTDLGNLLRQNLQCEVSYAGGNLTEMSILTYPSVSTSPGIDPAVNPFEALRTSCFVAVAPTATTDPVLITTEPYNGSAGGYIRAVFRGIAVCMVNISDTSHQYATPSAGVTSKLASAATGQVRILYRPSGTGDKVCVVDVLGVNIPASTGGTVWEAALTEATGAASWAERFVNSSGTWGAVSPPVTGTDNAYPVEMDGASFVPKATAKVLMWADPVTGGYYDFLPIQSADKVSSTYYPGFVGTNTQNWTGAKFLDTAMVSPNISSTSVSNVEQTFRADHANRAVHVGYPGLPAFPFASAHTDYVHEVYGTSTVQGVFNVYTQTWTISGGGTPSLLTINPIGNTNLAGSSATNCTEIDINNIKIHVYTNTGLDPDRAGTSITVFDIYDSIPTPPSYGNAAFSVNGVAGIFWDNTSTFSGTYVADKLMLSDGHFWDLVIRGGIVQKLAVVPGDATPVNGTILVYNTGQWTRLAPPPIDGITYSLKILNRSISWV